MKRRILAILLAAIMVLSAVPFSVFAEDATVACPGQGEIHTKDNCDFVKFKDVPPVCDTQGYTVYTCEGCGDQFAADIIPATDTPHKLVKATKAATCDTTGIAENVWQCTVCKAYFKDADAKDKYTDKSYETAKLNHMKAGVSQFKTLADDCTKEKCELCGKVQTISTHKYHEWTLVNFVEAPTCKDTSTANYKCATKGCTATKTVTVEASKYMHNLTYVAATNPVCGPNGNIEHYSCSVCGKNYATKDAKIEDALKTVKANHTQGALQSVIVATCTQKGIETYQCTVCLANYDVDKGVDADYIYNIKDSKGNLLKTDKGVVRVFVKEYHKYVIDGVEKIVDDTKYEIVPAGTDAKNLVVVDIYHFFNPQADAYTKETCTTYGYVQRLCVKCGYVHNEQVKEPTGHTIAKDATPTVVTPASCLTAGTAKYTCATCSAEVVATIPAKGHKDKVVKLGDCATKGFIYTICENGCSGYGYTKTTGLSIKVGDKTETATITEASVKDGSVSWGFGDHNWKADVINAATCTTAGSQVKYCTICSTHSTEVIPAIGHKYVLSWADSIAKDKRTLENSNEFKAATADQKIAPTCTDAGYLKLACANCGGASTANDKGTDGKTTVSLKYKNANGHDDYVKTVLPHCVDLNNDTTKKYDKDNKWNDTKGYTVTYCPTCDKELSARTATGAVYSLAIEYTLDDARAIHNIDGVTPVPYIAGDCVVKGLDKYTCKDCTKAILVVQGNTGAHVKPANVTITPATCFADGEIPAYTCERCNNTVAKSTIPALKHNFTKVFDGTAATCTAKGVKAIYTCSQACCAKTFFVDVEYNKDGSLKNATKLEWAAGTKDADKTLANAKKIAAAIIGTKAHTAGTEHKKVEPTCLNTGKKAYIECKVCGQFFTNYTLSSDKKTIATGTVTKAADLVIKANGHSYVDATVGETCTTPGYVYQECSVCDFSRVINYKAALGHDWKLDDGKKGVKATCTVVGGDYYTCVRGCTKIENRVEMLDHVNKDGLAIGHGTATIICTVGLKDEQLKCKNCSFTATKNAHIEKTTTVPATCTTAGYTVVTCAGCNEVLEEKTAVDTLPALNHKYADGSDAWKLTKTDAATETATGTKYFECQLCKATKTEVIPPVSTIYLDLTYANANGKEGFAEYSLITVNVLLSSKKAAIRTLSYELNYDETKLEFVSANFDNTFSIASINDDNGAVKFAGMSPNAVEVGEAAVIATITFRALAAGDAEFYFEGAEAYLEAGAKVEANVDLNEKDDTTLKGKIAIATLMDVYTKDTVAGTIDMQDALAIYDLMTNSEYNVAADLDKDGEITANDLQLFYSIFVGKMEKAALRNYEVN